jgi:hypothetical protein
MVSAYTRSGLSKSPCWSEVLVVCAESVLKYDAMYRDTSALQQTLVPCSVGHFHITVYQKLAVLWCVDGLLVSVCVQ